MCWGYVERNVDGCGDGCVAGMWLGVYVSESVRKSIKSLTNRERLPLRNCVNEISNPNILP